MLRWRLSWQREADCSAITGQGLGAEAACSERCASLARAQERAVLGHCILVGTQKVLNSRLCLDLHTCSNTLSYETPYAIPLYMPGCLQFLAQS